MFIRLAFASFNTKVVLIGSTGQVPNWEEEGYTPHVFAKSAEAIERKGVELPHCVEECAKSAQVIKGNGE